VTALDAVLLNLAEAGLLPDRAIRFGIRRLLKLRLRELAQGSAPDQQLARFIAEADASSIAEVPDLANRQHYEVSPEFFRTVLGHRLKYSCCHWDEATTSLDESEDAALAITCERASIADGQKILDLGCGWGSLSLWMAERYPGSHVTSVSNSSLQREFIERRAEDCGLDNIRVITADMNDFDPADIFDRVVSVEMFEHMRNHRELLGRISNWLRPGGQLFVHVFCHRVFAYLFETNGPQDWMAEHFFTGGMMPSESLLDQYDDHLRVVEKWTWNGRHYARTCRAWLDRTDAHRQEIHDLFADCYGPSVASRWIQRWRIFFMACEELFAFDDGTEWYVSHARFGKAS
tara:strand:- start:1695 stop:2735 length:1041 start_codon:yes stop_codon:yes gene_type:complete